MDDHEEQEANADGIGKRRGRGLCAARERCEQAGSALAAPFSFLQVGGKKQPPSMPPRSSTFYMFSVGPGAAS